MADRANPVRIVLADDHQVMRRGLQLLLDAEPDLDVVGQAGDVESARSLVREQRPDVLLLREHARGGVPGGDPKAPR